MKQLKAIMLHKFFLRVIISINDLVSLEMMHLCLQIKTKSISNKIESEVHVPMIFELLF